MTLRSRLLGLSDRALVEECEVDLFRASGPGGQKRNKTDNAVRLRHAASGLSAQATGSRSQAENRAVAISRLRQRVALEVREPVELAGYRPPAELASLVARPGAVTRRERGGRDYLLAVAQLLDLLAATGGSIADTARLLGLGSAAAARLITGDEALARKVAELRASLGLAPLR